MSAENCARKWSRLQMLLDVSTIMASNSNLQQGFPQISARIRRLLQHEYAGFEVHDPSSGLLIRQAEDFPLGKGLLSSQAISPHDSPGGRSLQEGTALIFSKNEMQGFDAEITKSFLAEGLQSPVLPSASPSQRASGSSRLRQHPQECVSSGGYWPSEPDRRPVRGCPGKSSRRG